MQPQGLTARDMEAMVGSWERLEEIGRGGGPFEGAAHQRFKALSGQNTITGERAVSRGY